MSDNQFFPHNDFKCGSGGGGSSGGGGVVDKKGQ